MSEPPWIAPLSSAGLTRRDAFMVLQGAAFTLDVLLSALEPENARSFIDEYLEIPIALDSALWLASANNTGAIPNSLLSRMIVVDVPRPTRAQAALIVRTIAGTILQANDLDEITDAAVASLLDLSARQARLALEIACGFAVYERRDAITVDDIRRSLVFIERRSRRPIGFMV